MNPEDNLVHLKIFGEDYKVKSKADESYLQNVASYVDKHMREIADNLPASQPTLRVAILAAMNIADEVFELRKQLDGLNEGYSAKTKELEKKIDEALAEHAHEEIT